MDSLNHFAAAYIMTKAFNLSEPVNIASGIIGALPDLIGFAEKVIKWDKNAWSWYNKAHKGWKWLRWIPQWGLHIWLDKHSHEPGQKWWKFRERFWLEVWTWDIVLFIYVIELLGQLK